jgi:hypothetical protein
MVNITLSNQTPPSQRTDAMMMALAGALCAILQTCGIRPLGHVIVGKVTDA